MAQPNYDVLLLDIEGTTTPITFVYDVLFPYARSHMKDFLSTHWDEDTVQQDLQLIQQQYNTDKDEGIDSLPALATPDSPMYKESVLGYLLWQMDNDRKTTGLKSLQGKIWKRGFESGEIKGVVFDDIPEVFELHKQQDIPIYIYSSGSIQAQKLLFGHTTFGDLLPYLKGHYDTTTGPKKEAHSYTLIAQDIGIEPTRILFATDILAEAVAAQQAGCQAIIMERPGNHPQPTHTFPTRTNLLLP
ncbi:MAG TPA: acireductone synthase [Myxococcales bacterium]|nr:acireductone synthase [Deltaproteobacteria bacterium]MBU53049.1 acireductone synthase [Deltaproteobacteria bacterium]HAA56631.1 acireductone synthase [Myxococcales bacterium]|tara:strand:- start:6464 stop:7198 length:735 start_codon:yes stop_codon:yes gene_type:complete